MAAVTLIVVVVLAWKGGRTYCNTICPVGTVLGLLSRYSIFRPVIDAGKCTSCSLCSRRCKASCIDFKNHKIDYSRCVACMDCLDVCNKGAISFTGRHVASEASEGKKSTAVDGERRAFLSVTATAVAAAALKAQEKRWTAAWLL